MTEIEVIRSRRKSLSLEVKADGRVLLRAPLWAGQRQLKAFAEKNRDWIARKQEEARLRREDS